jgi:cytochrome c oxidase subunit 3
VKEHHFAHHFPGAQEEFEASKLGMWVFLVTEVLMFGGLFVAYTLLRHLYPDMFHEAHQMLNWKLGGLNTLILISSSLSMALAVGSAQRSLQKRTSWLLVVTLLCAAGFLVVKGFEYHHKFVDGLLPAGYFTNKELTHPKAPLFFSLYFCMTGLHGIHVLVGMGLIFWVWLRNRSGEINGSFFTPVELVGYYWHLVDLVWIYLFPLLYLVG